jgi:hypothetical protein
MRVTAHFLCLCAKFRRPSRRSTLHILFLPTMPETTAHLTDRYTSPPDATVLPSYRPTALPPANGLAAQWTTPQVRSLTTKLTKD